MRKKMIVGLLFLLMASSAKADNLIVATLLDHVMTVTQFKSGETKLALMDSVVQIGSVNNESILDLQAGFSGETKPEPGEASAANVVVGGFFKVSTLMKGKVNFPEQWKFLNSIEHGAAWNYDLREKDSFFCYQVGLAFGLNPN